MYLANYTRPDISFDVNLLARYNSSPTRRHWNKVKHLLRYLRFTIDMGLFYTKVSRFGLTGYTDAGYLSDSHNGRSQTSYLLTCGGTTISWRSMKQTIVATSSNHAELLAYMRQVENVFVEILNSTHTKYLWFVFWKIKYMKIILHTPFNSIYEDNSTTIYEDNTPWTVQFKDGYIKRDRTKHISPKFFSTHDLQKSGDINIQQTC